MILLPSKRVSTFLVASLLVGVSSAAAPEAPFKEKGVGTVSSVVPGHLSFAGSGTASHLGKFTEVGSNDFDDQGNIFNGHFTTTASDGATVSGVYSGTFAPQPSGKIQFNLTVTWLEGTGRLTGATGQLNVVALLDAVAPGATFEYEGLGSVVLP